MTSTGDVATQPRATVRIPAAVGEEIEAWVYRPAGDGPDSTRMFIWGTSFSGLHAVEIAATDSRLRGAVAQNPLVDGLAGTRIAPPLRSLHLLAVGVLDRIGSLLGRPPRYIPAGAGPGEFGVVANAAALAGLEIIRPKDGAEWHNRVAARSILGAAGCRARAEERALPQPGRPLRRLPGRRGLRQSDRRRSRVPTSPRLAR